jgi:hypothetical protein
MKPSENVRDYFSRLDKTNNIIMDAYDSYTILPDEPVLQNQADTLLMRTYVRECNLNVAKFFLLNHFRAGLPSELRRVLNLQNQDELRLNHAVKLATIEQRSREEAKNRNKVSQRIFLPQTLMALRLMLFARPPLTTGNLQDDISHNWLGNTINSDRRMNSGDKTTTRVTTPLGMARRASFARCRITDKRNVAKGSRPTNLAWTPTDGHSGQRSTLLTPTQPILWRLRQSPSRIFSDELDGTPTSSSPRHSSVNIESLCHLHCDIQ